MHSYNSSFLIISQKSIAYQNKGFNEIYISVMPTFVSNDLLMNEEPVCLLCLQKNGRPTL